MLIVYAVMAVVCTMMTIIAIKSHGAVFAVAFGIIAIVMIAAVIKYTM